AIDLGCGTGTNVIYLAQHGFQAVGVDISSQAVAKARSKAQQASVAARFHVGDVTRLGEPHGPPVEGPFDLALDMGCLHSLKADRRLSYASALAQITRPGAVYLLYAFKPGQRGYLFGGPPGISPQEVEAILTDAFRLVKVEEGSSYRPSAWYRLERS
ncbi:MAG: class I SAM-dependent methyltransferase, partial [Anaerolineae bacterium]